MSANFWVIVHQGNVKFFIDYEIEPGGSSPVCAPAVNCEAISETLWPDYRDTNPELTYSPDMDTEIVEMLKNYA